MPNCSTPFMIMCWPKFTSCYALVHRCMLQASDLTAPGEGQIDKEHLQDNRLPAHLPTSGLPNSQNKYKAHSLRSNYKETLSS